MPISRTTFEHPTTGARFTLNSSLPKTKWREVINACKKVGYIAHQETEGIQDFQSAEDALDVLNHLMPMD